MAQGSIFSIFGTGLGPPLPGVQAGRFPIESTLAGVTLRLQHQTGEVLAAYPLFASAGQINALLPSNTPIGLVLVSVSYQGRSSSPEPVKVVRSSFGTFTRNSAGSGPAIVQNFVSPSELPLNAPSTPARPGQTVILWGTGLGPITAADNLAPPVGDRAEPVEVTLGTRPVTIDYRGRSGCCSGVDQINFRIPPDSPLGCAVPLGVKVQNSIHSNLTSIAISADGSPCRDTWNPPGTARRWGEVFLVRTVTGSNTQDQAGAYFTEGAPAPRIPVTGTCTSALPRPTGGLAAGPELALSGPQGRWSLVREAAVGYAPGPAGAPLVLVPGAYSVTAPGGADIGPFQASLVAGSPLVWTSLSGARSSGLTVNWTGGDPATQHVVIASESFICTAAVTAGSLRLPEAVTTNLPPQLSLRVGSLTLAAFEAPGLDRGALSYTQWTARTAPVGEPLLAASPIRLPGGQVIMAEIAAGGAERQRGLMQRPSLEADRGMLFLFERSDSYSFWMFRTLIPLDIIWMDSGRRVVFISANTPPCPSENSLSCPVYGGREPSQYVLEIGAGQAARYGLRLGDRLEW